MLRSTFIVKELLGLIVQKTELCNKAEEWCLLGCYGIWQVQYPMM
jgi:hypothetical protein